MINLTDYITKLINGETYQEISNRCYTKGYDEGYAEGYEKGERFVHQNNVVFHREHLDQLIGAIGKKRWSRKGYCPSCNVYTGSNHNKNCKLLNNN